MQKVLEVQVTALMERDPSMWDGEDQVDPL